MFSEKERIAKADPCMVPVSCPFFPGEDLERSCQGFFRLFSIPAASFVMYSHNSCKLAIVVG